MARPMLVTAEEILDSALHVFGHWGYRRTSMDMIAEECGISRPTLYLRFANKHELFLAVGRRALDRVYSDAAAAAADDAPPLTRLLGVLAAKLNFLESHFGGASLRELAHEGGDDVTELVDEFTGRHRQLVIDLLTEALISDAAQVADVFLDAVSGISLNAATVAVARERIRHLIALVIDGAPRRETTEGNV